MSKIRINELARQLEVKSREVIDKLHELGIAEKVTHSSSIDDEGAEQLRRYYRGEPIGQRSSKSSGNGSRAVVTHDDEPAETQEAAPAPPVEKPEPKQTQ